MFDRVVAGFPPPRLSEPLNPHSRPVRRVGVRHVEVSGHPVLWGPMIDTVCELSPSAALLWLDLDGRTLAEILRNAPGLGIGNDDRSVVEIIRSMRVLGLVEDLHGSSEPGPYRHPADSSTTLGSTDDPPVVVFEDETVDGPRRLAPIELLDRMMRTREAREFEALARRCEHLVGFLVPVGTSERELNALVDRADRADR